MSRSGSNKGRPAERSGPSPTARGIRNFTLLALVLVNFVIAVSMVVTFFSFVFAPDPDVKAGPMYVTLAFTTLAALLMFFLGLNASYLPFLSPQRARDVRLVTWTMAGTGAAVGVLTLGAAVQSVVARLFCAGLAFFFIRMQEVRIERARRNAVARVGTPAADAQPQPKSRQRRGGRNR